jgi:photosystem II stability/assembly factor-like uncharacterized protein
MRLPALLVAGAALAGLVAVGLAGAGVGRWGPSHGPDGASVAVLAIDPVNSAIVYAGTDHGVFKTTDGGQIWRAAGPAGQVSALAIDPQAPTTIYAAAYGGAFAKGRVFKTTNGGQSWKAVSTRDTNALAIDPQRPSTVYAATYRGVFRSPDAGQTWASAGLGGRIVTALATDPRDPGSVYACTTTQGGSNTKEIPGGIFKTTDAGRTWREIGRPVNSDVSALIIDPQTSAILYAGAGSGLFKSIDGGESWTQMGGGSTFAVDFSTTPHTIYSIVYGSDRYQGVRSIDGGETWQAIGLPTVGWTNLVVVDPRRPATLYLGAPGDGLFRSTDRGETWRGVSKGLPGRRINVLAVDPRNSRMVYAAGYGLYRSKDGASSWQPSGLSQVYFGALAIDPLRPSRIYAGGRGGVYRSADGGHRWRASTNPLLKIGVTALAVDPVAPSTVYAIAGNAWLGPKPWRLVKSSDGGKSWRAPKPGLSGKFVFSIALDPQDSRTLYAGTWPALRDRRLVGGGVFKSTNGGRTWKPAGLAKRYVSALAVDPQAPTTVYAVAQEIFKSTNGGRTWRKSGRGIGRFWTGSLAIDPRSPTTLYASVCLSSACFEGPGVFRSTNGGKTWRSMNQGLRTPDVLTLAIDSTGRTLYAGTGAGVFDYSFPR